MAVREFLCSEFTKTEDCDYRLTAALAEAFVASDDIAGLLYPTVTKSCNSDNIALAPWFVDDGLRLVDAQLVLVDAIEADGSISGEIVARLESTVEGRLKWAYQSTSTTMLSPGSAALIRAEPGSRSRVIEPGSIQIDGHTYELQPGYAIEFGAGEVRVTDLQRRRISPVSSAPFDESEHPETYGDGANAFLGRFATLFAVATESVEMAGTDVAVSVCFRAALTLGELRWTLQMSDGIGVELHNPVIPPERIAWSAFIHEILRGQYPAPTGIIVDAMPKSLDGLNSRTEPIRGELYLPDSIELIYGCRGCEDENAANAALAFCRREIGTVLDKLKAEGLQTPRSSVAPDLCSALRRIKFEPQTPDAA